MAIQDIRVKTAGGALTVPVIRCNTEAAATAIVVGDPVKYKTAGSRYVIPMADAEPVIGTTTAMVGIACSTSTQTASADGVVDVYAITADTVLVAKAKSAAAADTEAEIIALKGKRILVDLTSGVYTVDTATTDGATNGFIVVGGNATTKEIWFQVRPAALEGAIA